MLHMQHHFLCNVSYVVIAGSMEKSFKYTTSKDVVVKEILKQPLTRKEAVKKDTIVLAFEKSRVLVNLLPNCFSPLPSFPA